VIYFILAQKTNRLKIGYSKSASEVDRRFNFLLRENADDLDLIGRISGEIEDERCLHSELEHIRCHNEWFDYTEEAQELVRRELSHSAQ